MQKRALNYNIFKTKGTFVFLALKEYLCDPDLYIINNT